MSLARIVLSLLPAFYLLACTSASVRHRQDTALPAPLEQAMTRPAAPPQQEPPAAPPPQAQTPARPPQAAPSASPVIAALLHEAEGYRDSGRLDNAAASLERAIRIQPRNAKLWGRLAEVRLQQGQPGLAEDLAKKSNLLAKGDAELLRGNWSVIAQARRQKGDAEGAADAEAKAAGR
jgi:cytochrome c-type biogenesis protein CcmH/NrfG